MCGVQRGYQGFRTTVLYLGAVDAIALSVLIALWSLRPGSHIAVRTAGISDDPRYAAFARGIPPLEQPLLRSRGGRHRDYQSRTSMFLPLPSQKGVVT